ncbi:uncharacterized protein EDB91DRAFT_173623 [Suillus paluster]|uniref:uncharacterized protein n=1 Tax=Suillus paluster TaxID=48578 RepID=UPI001B860242|nr:uncharacterized protein EDB91DRAFT_173623 [Suillus paluster]KAG1745071.1 hypothetical protein EDB91DRAFT_173623 [Suillus paluster]
MSYTIPQVRRRPTKLTPSGVRPNSNVVRASVLETALELGIAHSSTVANWIFNSPLPEELEELEDIPPEMEAEETLTPALTFGSHTASDDSSSIPSPQHNVASARQIHTHKPSVFDPVHVHFNDFASAQLTLSLPPLSTPAQGRETSGSISSGKPSNDVAHQSSEDVTRQTDRKCATPSSAKSEAGYGSDGQYLSDSAGLKKSGKAKGKIKKAKPPALDLHSGYGGEPGYTSDGGYLSASSSKSQGKSSKGKSRAMAFFRRKPKKSQQPSDDEDDNYIPPVPAIPPMPVPSSPRPLKHLTAAPSSPTRSGFTPLTLNFNTSTRAASPVLHSRKDRTSPPPARVVSPSPTPSPRPSEQTVNSILSPSPSPPPPSMPALALPLAPISRAPSPSTPLRAVSPPTSKSPVRSSPLPAPRHISIRPAAPPPTQPLPQPPPFPMQSTPSRRAPGPPPMQALPPVPVRSVPIPPSTPTTPSRRLPPFRPVAVPGPTAPLVPRRNPQGQPRVVFAPRPQPPHTASDSVIPQYMHANADASPKRYQTHSAAPSDESFESPSASAVRRQHSDMPSPLFLQRRMHGVQSSPRHPPPDSPLPQVPNARPIHPSAFPSKFHEHFSSVSSMGHTSAGLLTPRSASGSGSSSDPSVRSTRSSNAPSLSTSDSHGRSSRHSGGVVDTGPEMRSSFRSETSYGKSTASISRAHSHSSMLDTRSDVSASVYDERLSTYDEEGGNDPKGAQADDEDDDDDASFYPSDEKTAGRCFPTPITASGRKILLSVDETSV